MEGFSEALAKEVAHLNIRVSIVEPGPFRTDWAGGSMKFAVKKIDDYKPSVEVLRERIQGYSGKQAGDPERGAKAIVALIDMPHPPLRLPLGRIAVATIRSKLAQVADDVNKTEPIALATDFPTKFQKKYEIIIISFWIFFKCLGMQSCDCGKKHDDCNTFLIFLLLWWKKKKERFE